MICFFLFFRYVFKRLRFLGNKTVSQCSTLFYLALWHGLDTGYYMCFFLEFIYLTTERKVSGFTAFIVCSAAVYVICMYAKNVEL
jgi:hypothetical protein